MLRIIGIFCLIVLLGASSPDPWAPIRELEGRWKGEGQGFGQTSEVTHDWQFVLGEKFLRLETRAIAKTENGDGEVHEDVGYVSWSNDDSVLRFRQFLSEGFVNTFRIEVATDRERGLNFEPEASEGAGGMLARMTLTFLTDDSYEMVLELGREGKPFKPCQTMRMQKMK
jgi:hypothetical protein